MDVIQEFSFNHWIEVGIAIFAVLGAFVYKFFSSLRIQNKKFITDVWNVHSSIHECLTELRVLTDAARAQVIQFHNGEYFMDGVSMRKLSCTHESLAKGVSAQGDKTTNLLISLFTPLIEEVTKDNSIPHLVKNEKDGFNKSSLETANVHSYCVLPLRHRNMISGFIMIQWCSPNKAKQVINNPENIQNYIESARNQIEVYLMEQSRGK